MVSDETEEMFDLGQAVFLEGIKKLQECKERNGYFIHERSALIIKKRLAVVEFTHGLELILKAVLIRKGYSICKVKNGIFKSDQIVRDIVNPERTIDFEEVITFFKREYREYQNCSFNSIDELKKLRNQIIHRGTQIDQKKKEYFVGAIDCLSFIYEKENIKHNKFIAAIEKSKDTI